jgi:hypothetical protein
MHAGVPKFVDRRVIQGPLGGMSPPALPANSELLCDKFKVNIQQKNQDNKGAKDPVGGWSFFPPNSEEPADIKRRRRRRYTEEERKQVAATRKRGACHECRARKIKV